MTWEEQIEAVRTHPLIFRLSRTRTFSLTGRDHLRYLHSRSTQEVKGLAIGESRGALILTPNGRTLGIFKFFRTNEGITLVVDEIANEEEVFRGDLLRFKVADDVQLTDLSEMGIIYTLQGEGLDSVLGRLQRDLTLSPTGNISELPKFHGILVPHRRGLFPGCDILLPRSTEGEFLGALTKLGVHLGDDDGLEAMRILARVPKYGAEITERTVASDLPLEGLVSFTKGCYAGQEVVEMATSRGKPNRELALFEVPGGIQIGDPILSSEDGKPVGVVTSIIYGADGTSGWCLGFVKAELEKEQAYSVGERAIQRRWESQ